MPAFFGVTSGGLLSAATLPPGLSLAMRSAIVGPPSLPAPPPSTTPSSTRAELRPRPTPSACDHASTAHVATSGARPRFSSSRCTSRARIASGVIAVCHEDFSSSGIRSSSAPISAEISLRYAPQWSFSRPSQRPGSCSSVSPCFSISSFSFSRGTFPIRLLIVLLLVVQARIVIREILRMRFMPSCNRE